MYSQLSILCDFKIVLCSLHDLFHVLTNALPQLHEWFCVATKVGMQLPISAKSNTNNIKFLASYLKTIVWFGHKKAPTIGIGALMSA